MTRTMILAAAISALFLLRTSVDATSAPVTLADGSICVEGYIMDKFCIETNTRQRDIDGDGDTETVGVLLDASGTVTLQGAEKHTVHCIVDVGNCRRSGYEVLSDTLGSDGKYIRQATLDDFGNSQIVTMARKVGSCGTCDNGYNDAYQASGFRATVVGTWSTSAQDEPRVLSVSQVLDSSVGCSGANIPPPPPPQGGNVAPSPTMAPTRAGTLPAEAIDSDSTDCESFTTKFALNANPKLEMSYKILLDDPESFEDATLPNGDFHAEMVLERGSGWLGFGMSKSHPKMVQGEAVIGLPDETVSASNPGMYVLANRVKSGVYLGATQSLKDGNVVQNSTHTVLSFTRRLVEEGMLSIDVNGVNDFMFAVGFSNALDFHQTKGVFSTRLQVCVPGTGATGNAGKIVVDTPDTKQSAFEAHGNILTVAWGLITPLAISSSMVRGLFVNAGKPKLWFQIHMFLNMTCFVLTIVGFALAVSAVKESAIGEPDHFKLNTPHTMVGLVIVILVTVQVASGLLRPHLPAAAAAAPSDNMGDTEEQVVDDVDAPTKVEEKSTLRVGWEVGHKVFGVGVVGISWWQVTTGWDIYATKFAEEDYTYKLWAMIGAVGGLLVVGKIYQFATSKKQ